MILRNSVRPIETIETILRRKIFEADVTRSPFPAYQKQCIHQCIRGPL